LDAANKAAGFKLSTCRLCGSSAVIVFAIETKFRSGQGEITFRNGEGLFIDGFPEEKDSLKQAQGNAREVHQLIKDNCGLYEWVWPLVVFVGDWRVKKIFCSRLAVSRRPSSLAPATAPWLQHPP
jgi:hypothetical protein